MKQKTIAQWGVSLSILLQLVACATFELNEQVAENPYGSVTPQYNWGEGQQDKGTNMYVLLHRILNATHYVLTVDKNGQYLSPAEADQPATEEPAVASLPREEGDAPQETPETPAADNTHATDSILPGEYNLLTITRPRPTNGISPFRLSNVDRYAEDLELGFQDISILVQSMEETDIPALAEVTDPRISAEGDTIATETEDIILLTDQDVMPWTEVNSQMAYLAALPDPIFYGQLENQPITGGGQTNSLPFELKQLTQHIAIPFQMNVESGIVVNRVVAELSGVADSVNLAHGTLSPDAFNNRIVFEAKCANPTEALRNYTAETDIVGLLPPASTDITVGKGILRLAVYASMPLDDRPGTWRTRVFVVTRNLGQALQETPSLIRDEETGTYTLAATSVELNGLFSHPLNLTKAKIMSENTGGADEWEDNEDIPGIEL